MAEDLLLKVLVTVVEKSHLASLFVHLTAFSLCLWHPIDSRQPFATPGQTEVITLEARWSEASPPISAAVVEPSATSAEVSAEDTAIRHAKTPPQRVVELQQSSSAEATQRLPPPPLPPSARLAEENRLRRRPPSEQPRITEDIRPLPQRSASKPAAPSVSVAVPVQPPAGTAAEEVADLSGNDPPTYPLEAVRRRLEGRVLLELHITALGAVDRVDVLRSSGHAILDRAAVRAVSRWRGTPARRWGRAVESTERLPIRFRL